jgi:hypothetical protein
MEKVPYMVAFGSIIHVMIIIKPNIVVVIIMLHQFMQNSGYVHWKAVK